MIEKVEVLNFLMKYQGLEIWVHQGLRVNWMGCTLYWIGPSA